MQFQPDSQLGFSIRCSKITVEEQTVKNSQDHCEEGKVGAPAMPDIKIYFNLW